MNRVAVVGADGFIGRHLVAALRSSGLTVATYSRADEPHHQPGPDLPDVVFYLASSITPALAEQNPAAATADQARFASQLRRLADSARPPTVVLTSSAGTVYDPDAPGPWAEAAPTRPTSRYGAAKLALEQLLHDYRDTVPAVVLRLSNVYGPGQRVDKSQGVLGYWLRAAATDQPLQLIGDPRTTRDYVYVHDVVECMLRVATRSPARAGRSPAVFNVASGVSATLADLLSTVEFVVGRELPVQALPGRAIDRRDTSLDVRRAARWIGWRPQTSLVDGVTAMWHHVRAEHQLAEPVPAES